jgi:hypothetical protein
MAPKSQALGPQLLQLLVVNLLGLQGWGPWPLGPGNSLKLFQQPGSKVSHLQFFTAISALPLPFVLSAPDCSLEYFSHLITTITAPTVSSSCFQISLLYHDKGHK